MWVVGVLQPGGLTRAQDHLQRQAYETYAPRCYCPHERRVILLFPGYLLVKLIDRSWTAVRSTRGIASVLMMGVKPGSLGDEEITKIKAAEGEDGLVRVQRIGAPSPFRRGQRVRLLPRARLAGNKGSIVEYQGDATGDEAFSHVLMRLLGRYIPLVVHTEDLVAL